MSRLGNKAFARCDVKVVRFKDFVYENGDDGKEVLSTNPSEDTREFAGNSAVLYCPRTEDGDLDVESQFSDHNNRLDALNSLKKLAGELICRDCRYSSMTPAEVSADRAVYFRAEAEKLSALAALEMARNELQQVTTESLTSLAPPPEITS